MVGFTLSKIEGIKKQAEELKKKVALGSKTPDFLQQTFDIKVGDARELSSICHSSDEDSWELFEQRKKRSIFGRRKSTYTLRGEGYL